MYIYMRLHLLHRILFTVYIIQYVTGQGSLIGSVGPNSIQICFFFHQ